MTLDLAGRTHVGLKRSENQDEVYAELLSDRATPLACLAVADGMGGHTRGREASQRAIEAVRTGVQHRLAEDGPFPTEDWCVGLEIDAHRSVKQISSDAEVTGTTLTFALLNGAECLIGHVGDSRAYRYHDGKLVQLTEDHSWEVHAQKHGIENLYGRALRQAVGVEGEFEPETHRVELIEADWLVLCSDGLYKMAALSDIEAELANSRGASEACDRLINLALAGGGKDNIGVCIARFGAPATPARTTDRILIALFGVAAILTTLLILAAIGKLG